MKISFKPAVAAAAVFLGILSLLWLVDRAVVVPAFDRLARIQAEEDVARVRLAVERELEGVKRLSADWANWDSLYEFVLTRDDSFLRANLPEMPLFERTTSLNLGYIFDLSGRVLFGGIYDSDLGGELELEAFSGPAPPALSILRTVFEDGESSAGYLLTEHGILLLSARPILTSLAEGPSRGALVFGRFLDRDLAGELRERTRVDFGIFPPGDERLLEAEREILASRISSPVVLPNFAGHLHAYEVIPGLDGRPAALLRVPAPEEFARAASGTRWLLVRVLGIAVLAVLAAWVYLKTRPRPREAVSLPAAVWSGIFLVVLIGLALTAGLSLELRRRNREEIEYRFRRYAHDRAELISVELEDHLRDLLMIRGLYDSSEFVDRFEFRDFAELLLEDRVFRWLAWLPRLAAADLEKYRAGALADGLPEFELTELGEDGLPVSAAPREEYYPVYYLEPLLGYHTAIGFDSASNPGLRRAMERARDGGFPRAARILGLDAGDGTARTSLAVFVPVYGRRPEGLDLPARRRELEGFVCGLLDPGMLVETTLERLTPRGLHISLLDLSPSVGDSLIYRHHSRLGPSPELVAPGLYYSQDFDFVGRPLRVEIRPAAVFVDLNRSFSHWWVLAAGALFSLLLAFLLAGQQRRAVYLQSLLSGGERIELRRALRLKKRLLAPASALLAAAVVLAGWYSGGRFEAIGIASAFSALFLFILWASAGRAEERLGEAFVGREKEYEFRRRAEAEVAASEQKYRALAESVEAIPWEYDLVADRWTYVAPQVGRILGWRPEEWTNRKFWADRIDHRDRKRATRYCFEAVERGENHLCEYRFMKKNGGTAWLRDIASVEARDGVPVKLRGIMIDITASKEAEEERDRLREQLFTSQRMESVGRLAGGVAHDFNNMLQAILGHAELAGQQVDPASPVRRNLEEIITAGRRSADLASRLLAFARRQPSNLQVFKLDEIVSGILGMLKQLIREEIDLRWEPAGGPWLVRVDRGQVEQLLVNLMVNARDAIAGRGKITVRTVKTTVEEPGPAIPDAPVPGEYVSLSVSDTGAGMEREVLERSFEPFFTTKEMGRGTGLGLPTVYGIVKQNQGFIQVRSSPGRGAVFTIYFPRVTEGEPPPPPSPPPGELYRGTETVLVVEDDPAILELCAGILRSRGYRVFAAPRPSEALEIARETDDKIHLLISDVVMPEMNGRELAARIAELKPGIKTLFISGYPSNVIVHRNLLDRGVWLLKKPFSVEELSAKARQVIDS